MAAARPKNAMLKRSDISHNGGLPSRAHDRTLRYLLGYDNDNEIPSILAFMGFGVAIMATVFLGSIPFKGGVWGRVPQLTQEMGKGSGSFGQGGSVKA